MSRGTNSIFKDLVLLHLLVLEFYWNQISGFLFYFWRGSCLCSGPVELQTSDQYSVQSS